jgi:hypothetical protein
MPCTFTQSKRKRLVFSLTVGSRYGAAQGGNLEMINFAIDKCGHYVNNDWGLGGAAKTGQMWLIEFFINRGANDFSGALSQAIRGNQMWLVPFFIAKGVDNWNHALYAAAKMGNLDLVKDFISRGATAYEYAMLGALKRYNFEIRDYLERIAFGEK